MARAVRARWSDCVRAFVVTPQKERPRALAEDVPLILDGGELEERYGAQTECLYVIRPDLYVGFRSQPADEPALLAHLAAVLTG